MLWLPVLFVYVVAPLIDLALGTDRSNLPEEAVPTTGSTAARWAPRPTRCSAA